MKSQSSFDSDLHDLKRLLKCPGFDSLRAENIKSTMFRYREGPLTDEERQRVRAVIASVSHRYEGTPRKAAILSLLTYYCPIADLKIENAGVKTETSDLSPEVSDPEVKTPTESPFDLLLIDFREHLMQHYDFDDQSAHNVTTILFPSDRNFTAEEYGQIIDTIRETRVALRGQVSPDKQKAMQSLVQYFECKRAALAYADVVPVRATSAPARPSCSTVDADLADISAILKRKMESAAHKSIKTLIESFIDICETRHRLANN